MGRPARRNLFPAVAIHRLNDRHKASSGSLRYKRVSRYVNSHLNDKFLYYSSMRRWYFQRASGQVG